MHRIYVYSIPLNFAEIQSETINVNGFVKNNNCNHSTIKFIEGNTFCFNFSIKFSFYVCTEKKTIKKFHHKTFLSQNYHTVNENSHSFDNFGFVQFMFFYVYGTVCIMK